MIATSMIDQARGVSLLHLVEPDTPLTRIAGTQGGEYAGPCPFCGGTDRFHVVPAAGKWYCRHCHPRGGDAIDYVQRRERVAFQAAIALLTGAARLPPRPASPAYAKPSADAAWTRPAWQHAAQLLVEQAQDALDAPEGAGARAYLTGRGLHPATWQAWRLGCRWGWHPALQQKLPAITLPWHAPAGELMAVQYRFFTPPGVATAGCAAGLGKRDRFGQKAGGDRQLFGLPLRQGRGTLILCEGELNAVSLWQDAHTWADVLSFGAQDAAAFLDTGGKPSLRQAQLLVALQKLAVPYRQVIVWADEEPRAVAAATRIAGPQGHALWSDGGDANDWLQAGRLAERLTYGG